MRLTDLLAATRDEIAPRRPDGENLPEGESLPDAPLAGLTADSRQVGPGWLFAALPGTKLDGRDFIDQAVAQGAAAVLAPEGTTLKERGLKDQGRPVALLTAANPRRALARMAAAFYGRQPRHLVAVTGTSGKTSVAHFTRSLWALAGEKAASLGTLGLVPEEALAERPPSLTTPDPVALMRSLAGLAEAGYEHVALEASSHGLDQFRLDGLRLAAAAFTNLSHEHLDYHGTLEGYFAAKRRLFAELLPEGATAVVNADAPQAGALAALARSRGLRLVTFGSHERADLRLVSRRALAEGQAVELAAFGRRAKLELPLLGAFQVSNLLAALGLATAAGLDVARALSLLPRLRGVPGRLEFVARTPAGGRVYVDYAHKPAALEAVLETMRPHADGRLWVVVGCGGDRDRAKRPLMGAIAERLADQAIVTDDNPRSEEPAAIRAEVMAAAPGALEIGDRRAAIATAMMGLGRGDLLVIAGKGHESGQTVGERVLPFDDRAVAREIARGLAEGA